MTAPEPCRANPAQVSVLPTAAFSFANPAELTWLDPDVLLSDSSLKLQEGSEVLDRAFRLEILLALSSHKQTH